VRPGDIVGAIANEAGLPGRSIGAIDLYDETAFVEVPAAARDQVIQALGRTRIKGRLVQAQVADPGMPPPREGSAARRAAGPPPGARRAGPPRPRKIQAPRAHHRKKN
jgi:ATP-dependent RNA helicase DeaD